MEEIWKDIPDYEGFYQVSSLGQVRSLDRVTCHGRKIEGKIMKKKVHTGGYIQVCLRKNGSATNRRFVHRLVMLAFNGNKEISVDHINADRTDNRLENLEYVTQRENCRRGRLRLSNKASKYPCVGYNKRDKRWKPTVRHLGKQHYLGYFKNEEDAYRAVVDFQKTHKIEVTE